MSTAVEVADLPVISIDAFLKRDESEEAAAASAEQCALAAKAFREYGCLVVKDSRVKEEQNQNFLDMLEDYFDRPNDTKMTEVRPDVSYQVGATPSFTELPRNHCERMRGYKEADKPLSLCPPEKDPKWRFFWRLGARPESTEFAELNAEAVVPEGIPQWKDTMDAWGANMLRALENVAQMSALGFGLELDAFKSKMNLGPHLLAPTASNFNKFAVEGTVLAGYHYDLNFMTIHGRSRYPGLYIWTREGQKCRVKVPEGCLLVQAGKQFEFLTGGEVMAGFHEVVVNADTLAAVERRKAAGRPLWRISSTVFGHVASDQSLAPLPKFVEADPSCTEKYPDVKAGEQVSAELKAINLSGTVGAGGEE
jgi:isopenicillin N synthase-like dioxygenase